MPWLRNDALVDNSTSTEKNTHTRLLPNTPQTVLLEPPGGSGATPAGALARTRRQDKNPPDDSARISRGLGGSYRVHKPGVPWGPPSTPRLGPSRQHATDEPLQPHVSDRGTQEPCSPLFSDWRNQSRLGPTDRGRPPRKDQGTNGESKARRTSQTTIPRTVPCTPTDIVLCNLPITSNVVGADIFPYSIVGVINSHTIRLPPHASGHR